MATESSPYFVLEGNIGAGKSTFLKKIGEYLDVQLIFEPHQKWQHVVGNENILDKFYTDPVRWAYSFQTYTFVTRMKALQEHTRINYTGAIQVLERSVYSDNCFAQTAYENGFMSEIEWHMYQEWITWFIATYLPKPAGFIYIRVDPEVSFKRLQQRSRKEENDVSLAYLQQIHEKHDRWLLDKRFPGLEFVPVLRLDCNEDFEEDTQEFERHLIRIIEFLSVHKKQICVKKELISQFSL